MGYTVGYIKFHTEVCELLKNNPNLKIEEADRKIYNKWITEKKYTELVNYILENWNSGNCVEYMTPLTIKLIEEKEYELHHNIWGKIIKRQIDILFKNYAIIKDHNFTFEYILKKYSKHFNEFRLKSYSNSIKATAFFLHRVINSLKQWKNELLDGNQNIENIDLIMKCIEKLSKPKNDYFKRMA